MGGLCHIFVHNGFANRQKRRSRKFEMLYSKWNANDGATSSNAGNNMQESQPPACENKPNDIADRPKAACSYIAFACQIFSADHCSAERKKGKIRERKTGSPPRNANDCAKSYDAHKSPKYPRYNTTEYKPDNISKQRHIISLALCDLRLKFSRLGKTFVHVTSLQTHYNHKSLMLAMTVLPSSRPRERRGVPLFFFLVSGLADFPRFRYGFPCFPHILWYYIFKVISEKILFF
jgi:hypothetical protein